MFLVFESIPYNQPSKTGIPTSVRTAAVRSIETMKSWLPSTMVVYVIRGANGSTHYTTRFLEVPSLADSASVLTATAVSGVLPAAPPQEDSIRAKIEAILASGRRPTKAQLRKALYA